DPCVLAENLSHQLPEAVDDLGMITQLRRGVDHAERLDQPLHLVERAERVPHGAENGQTDSSGSVLSLLGGQVGADAPLDHLTVGLQGAVSRDVKKVADRY